MKASCLMSKPLATSAAVIAISFALGVSAFAQTSVANADLLKLSPFEVTSAKDQGYRAGNSVSGTRIAEPIGRLPFAISAFTPEFITDTKAEKLLDIVSYSPGVRSGIGNLIFGDSMFSIRGFTQSPQRNGFYNSSIANNFVDPAVIERAEVVKGPASLLYGQVSPGGTVNYITKSPTPVAFARLGVQGGNDSYGRSTLDLNRPIVGEKLLFRLNLAYENGAQYVDFGKYRSHLISPTVTWKITPRLSLKADYRGITARKTPRANTSRPPISPQPPAW